MSVDQAILQLIQRHDIGDQGMLLQLLSEQGHVLTQSTLSRRLKRLHVVKQEGNYRQVDPTRAPLPPCTLKDAPPNMLILRTTPGFAQAIAVFLDQCHLEGLAGTIAGDDTVFIALAHGDRFAQTKLEIQKALEKA